jgi:Fic family protein
MRRGEIGRFESTSASGEPVRAFVPAPLPPNPALVLDGPLQQLLEAATLAVGRLDAVSTLLPDATLFLYAYVRKEAVLSSQIEGTQSSLSDLLLFELEEAPGVPLDDVIEVSNYVAALERGLRRLRSDFPLSNRLIREIHGVLLSRGRGSTKAPGEFRRSQNWIGGSRPGNAFFVPPPHTLVPNCMTELERFLHATDDGLPVLIRAALAHLQFETIHPFLDGNGRVGRLLITLLLCHAGVLREPLLYLSLYLKQHRSEYYDMLNDVRRTGDWESWLVFFLEGVRATADGAVATSRRLTATLASDRTAIARHAGRRTGSALRVHDALKAHPILSLSEVRARTELSFPTVSSAMQLLTEQGIVRELTGRRRNRLYVYDRYLAILDDETEFPMTRVASSLRQ